MYRDSIKLELRTKN